MPESGGLFVIDAETGDTTQFDATNVSAGNEFTAGAGYKNKGTYGFRSYKDDSDVNFCYGRESFSTANDLYARCYVYVSSAIRNTAYANAPFFKLMTGPNTWDTNVMYVGVYFDSGGLPAEWRMYGPGAANAKTTTNFSTDAWHRVEMRYLKHATTGGCVVWIDGTEVYSDLDQDTTATSATDLFCGLFECAAVGYIYLDDIKMDTSAIGAYSDGGIAGGVSVVSSTSSLLPYIYHYLINNAVTGTSSLGTLMMYGFHNLINNVVSVASSIGNPVMYLYRYLINNTVSAVSSTVGNLTVILAAVLHALAGAINAVSSTSQMLMERWHYLINNAVTSASSIGNVLPYITRRLLPDTVDIVSSLIGNIEELGGEIYQALAGAVQATSSFIGDLYVQTYEFLSGAVEAAASLTGNLWVYGIRTLNGAINVVASTYGNLTGSISGALNKLRIYMRIHRGRF